MLNDRSSALSLLQSRRSAKPRDLVGPGPTPKDMQVILEIAARTPDHGKLFPWRFVLVGDDQRDAFGALLRQALVEHDPCATIAHHQKEDDFAHYAGQLVVLVSAPVRDH
jgi:nitroreductase